MIGIESRIKVLVVTTIWSLTMPSFLNSSITGLESSNSDMSFTMISSSPIPNIPAVPKVLEPFSCAFLIIFAAVGTVFPPAISITTTSPVIKSKLSSLISSLIETTSLKSFGWVEISFKKSDL